MQKIFVYFVSIIVALLTFLFFHSLLSQSKFQANFLKQQVPSFHRVGGKWGPSVANIFNVYIDYEGQNEVTLELKAHNKKINEKIEFLSPDLKKPIKKGNSKKIVYIRFPEKILENGKKQINLQIYDKNTKNLLQSKRIEITGPL